MDENLAEYYKEQIMQAETGVGKLLSTFFWAVTEREFSTEDIRLFNRLNKIYGRKIVFDSILDFSGVENVTGNITPLMNYFCKKNFNSSTVTPVKVFDADSVLERLRKAQKKNVQSR